MKIEVFDAGTGHLICEREIPEDVVIAAIKVEKWLKAQSDSRVILHGIKLSDY